MFKPAASRSELNERARKLLDAAQVGVARGAKLNQQLLSFARRQTCTPTSCA